jgi:cellulose synthase/poly-beta-1,6-N-acetylglucosamine synthase-like glycosyltransferase
MIGHNQQPPCEYFVGNNLVFWHVLSASENTTVQPKTLQFGGTVEGFRRILIESLGGWNANILAEDTDLTT